MRELRSGLRDLREFERRVNDVQRPEGYRLVASFEEGQRAAVAVAGFRVAHSLAWGRFIYVDDLSTRNTARRRGHARRLLDWLIAEARRAGCQQIHLDSGVGLERHDAHRLYLNSGFAITSHHFARLVAEGD